MWICTGCSWPKWEEYVHSWTWTHNPFFHFFPSFILPSHPSSLCSKLLLWAGLTAPPATCNFALASWKSTSKQGSGEQSPWESKPEVFCPPSGKGEKGDEPSRQPHKVLVSSTAQLQVSHANTQDCLVPGRCICTAHYKKSSLLQKVVLQLGVTPSMMKCTKCFIKVGTAVPTVKWAICMAGLQSTVNTELSGFLGFCMCDRWFRKRMLNSVGITFSWAPRGRWSICSPWEYLYLWTRSRCQQNERWLMSKELCWGISPEELCPMGYNLKQISHPWKPAPVTDASHFTENPTCLQKQEFQLKGGTCSWAVLTDVSATLVAGVETGAHTYFEVAQVQMFLGQQFQSGVSQATLPAPHTEQIPAATPPLFTCSSPKALPNLSH